MQRRIAELAVTTLGLPRTGTLDVRQGLRDVGLDSLMAVELRNSLQKLAGRGLPSTLLFDRPTVESLADFLLDQIDGSPKPVSVVAAESAADLESTPLSDADITLTDDAAELLLREELDALRKGSARES